MLSEFLKSKKFVMACLGVLAVVVTYLLTFVGVTVPEEKVVEFLGVVATYILGQGLSDLGKSAAALTAKKK